MNTIAEVKKEVWHREWAEQIQECQRSGAGRTGSMYTHTTGDLENFAKNCLEPKTACVQTARRREIPMAAHGNRDKTSHISTEKMAFGRINDRAAESNKRRKTRSNLLMKKLLNSLHFPHIYGIMEST